MLRGLLVRSLCLITLMAVPAAAEFTTYNTIGGLDPLSNFTTINFDGMTPVVCSTAPSCSSIGIAGVLLYGFQGSPAAINHFLQIVPENDPAQPWFNYNGTGTDPRLLRSDSAVNSSLIGFRIVLPSAVTAFGFQVMSGLASNISVNIDGVSISSALGPYPAGTLTTLARPNRSFFGVSSTTGFSYVDVISAPGDGNSIYIDNIAFGSAGAPPPGGGGGDEVAEPQSAIFLITGLGMLFLARRMKLRFVSSANLS
jgi:hypothetical protein